MESRRHLSGRTLRPPMAPTVVVGVGGATVVARQNSLKRTISKCGLDASGSANDLSGLASKKLAPLNHAETTTGNAISSSGLSLSQQQLQQIQSEAAIMRQHLYYYHQQQRAEQEQPVASNGVYVDDGEPVLLPRALPHGAMVDDDTTHRQYDYSPVAPFRWDASPQSAKNRYYESIIESSDASLVSPSPQHVLYPHTAHSSGRSTNSTVSIDSSSYSPYDGSVHSAAAMVNAQQQHAMMQDREYVSAANLHAIMVSYLDEMFQFYDLAKSFTFGRVSEMVQSVPFAFKYIQGLVKNRLGISWHLVGSFVENVLAFICDDDIRDASVKEFADFLRSIQDKLYESTPPGNILLNLYEFFQNVLAKFKQYLIQHWIAMRRIQFPCEFGKKSEMLFLCMECHREHL